MLSRSTTILKKSSSFLKASHIATCTRVGVLSILLSLAGCAAQMAYQDGKDLIAQNKVELGLAKFQQAIAADPENREYQLAFLQTRERIVATYLHQADLLAETEKFSEAEALYQRVFGIDPGNERARAGLIALSNNQHYQQLFKDAQAALDRNDINGAQSKLNALMAEKPQYPGAANLKRILAENSAQPVANSALTAAFRKPISIEFRDAQLKQVFEVIAMSSGLNFIFDKDVKTDQKTSIFLKNSTTESAIYMLLVSNQLEQQVLDGNTILIYPNTAAKQKEYQELTIKSYFLTNADAKTVANTIKTIVKSRDIVTDEKLNMVIVRDSPEAIKLVDKLVALHDSPEPEVMLDVAIMEVQRSRLMELGIQWPTNVSLTPLSSSGSLLTVRDLKTNINGSTIGVGIGPVVANVRKQDGDTNLLANPRIRARNHEKAKIMIGDRVPNITTTIGTGASAFVSESINYVDVGLKLEVEPTIYLDNDVAIRIGLEVSNIVSQLQTKSGTVAYQIGTRNASTVLRLKDGENQILAGLINDDDRNSANKVPGLGDLPILGRLFGSTLSDNQKTEIVLSITPHLIRNIQRPAAALTEFRSGTDVSFRGAPSNNSRSSNSVMPPNINPPNVSKALPSPVQTTPSAVPDSAANAIPSSTPSSNMYLQWAGRSQLKVGDQVETELIMESKNPVSGVAMTVEFDPSALQIIGVNEGEFLKQGGVQTTFSSQIMAPGQIQIKGMRSGGSASNGATNPGSIAKLMFRAIAPTKAAQLQLKEFHPTGVNGATLATPSISPYVIHIQP